MWQLYDHEEIMRVHDFNVARDASIMNSVAILRSMDLSFADIVEKIAAHFNLSYEKAEREVKEYWQ